MATPQDLGFTREGDKWVRWEQTDWGMIPARYSDEEMQRQFGAEIQSQQAAQQFHMDRNPDPYASYRGALTGLPTYQRVAGDGYDGYYSSDGRRLAGFTDTWGGGTNYYDINDLNRALPNWQSINVDVPLEQTEYNTVGGTGKNRMFGTFMDRPSSDGIIAGLNFGDIAQMAGLVAGAYGLGTSGLLPGAEAVGSASAGASAGASSGLSSGGYLGSGITPGVSSTGIGGGALGSGIAPGVSSTGIGGGALGSGISFGGASAAGLGALGKGYFAAETLGGIGGAAGGIGASGAGAVGGAGTAKSMFDKAKELAPFAPLLGAALGAGAGALGGTGKAGTITVEEGIPDWLMPYVRPTLDKYSSEVQNYNTDPYGIMPAAYQEFLNTVQGNYLDPSTNKWLPEYFRLGAERVKGTLSPSFGHMQAFGSNSGYNEALSRGLSDLAVGLYGGAYEKERSRQNDMIAAAPNFLTSATKSSFTPYTDYLSAIGGLGRKKDQPYFEPSALSQMFGGALTGYGLGNLFK